MAVTLDGTWVNQHGSEMTLSVLGNDLSGTYRTAVGEPGPKDFPLKGYVLGDLVGFSVSWGKPEWGITCWVGQLANVNGNDVLQTMWQLTTDVRDESEPEWLWSSVRAGADAFSRK